jgi:hypothetical protein
MIKLIMPMKRRPGMTVAEFREYYESSHRLLGDKYLKGCATKYVRRFTNPTPDRDGELREPEYDVFLEVWYPDQASFDACAKRLSEPDVVQEIHADEEKLFDMRYMRSYLVEEFESNLE